MSFEALFFCNFIARAKWFTFLNGKCLPLDIASAPQVRESCRREPLSPKRGKVKSDPCQGLKTSFKRLPGIPEGIWETPSHAYLGMLFTLT